MNPDGSHRQRLTRNPAYDWAPAVSPNGRRIAFGSDRDGDDEIFKMRRRRLPRAPAHSQHSNADADSAPYSPNGRRIVFESNRDGDYEIFKMRADGSHQRKLTDNSADDLTRPSSRRTASGSPSTAIAMAMPRSSSMRADGSRQHKLTRNTTSFDQVPLLLPGWQADRLQEQPGRRLRDLQDARRRLTSAQAHPQHRQRLRPGLLAERQADRLRRATATAMTEIFSHACQRLSTSTS